MGSFALDLSRFRLKTEKQMGAVIRKIAFELLTLVVRRSPVDTGRFRANNQVSINNLPSGAVIEFDKSGAAVIRDGNATLGSYSLGDTVFISNNVGYALELEYGSSKQAPQGIYRISVKDLLTHFDALVRAVR